MGPIYSLHGQSEGPGCYKWYQSNPASMANCVFSAPSGEKILKLRSNEDVVFLSGGECDTPYLTLIKGLIDYSYQQDASSFHESPYAKNSTVKRAWWGVILRWVTSWNVFLGAHE